MPRVLLTYHTAKNVKSDFIYSQPVSLLLTSSKFFRWHHLNLYPWLWSVSHSFQQHRPSSVRLSLLFSFLLSLWKWWHLCGWRHHQPGAMQPSFICSPFWGVLCFRLSFWLLSVSFQQELPSLWSNETLPLQSRISVFNRNKAGWGGGGTWSQPR